MFDSFIKQFGRILRYFSAPLVGLSVVYILDENGDVISSLTRFKSNNDTFTSWWPLIIFCFIFGATIYSLHRALIHSWLNPLIITHVKDEPGPCLAADLDRARAHRECDEKTSPAYSYQMRLNNTNSTCHFLWCSAWSVLLIPTILSFRFKILEWDSHCYFYCSFAFLLIFAAIITQVQTTRRDYWAYEYFDEYQGKQQITYKSEVSCSNPETKKNTDEQSGIPTEQNQIAD